MALGLYNNITTCYDTYAHIYLYITSICLHFTPTLAMAEAQTVVLAQTHIQVPFFIASAIFHIFCEIQSSECITIKK